MINRILARPTVCLRLFVDLIVTDIGKRVWHNWRRKDTEGLPSLMVFLWSAGWYPSQHSITPLLMFDIAGVPLGVYAIVQVSKELSALYMTTS